MRALAADWRHVAALQYLDWADLQKYLKALAEARTSLMRDPEYVQTFHREHLAPMKGDPKKVAA